MSDSRAGDDTDHAPGPDPANDPADDPGSTDAWDYPLPDELIAQSAEFRRFVFTAFSVRVTNLCRVIDDVAFGRLDIRLAAKLTELAHRGPTIAITQQQLAAELGSAREVVGRQLAEFQRRGWRQISAFQTRNPMHRSHEHLTKIAAEVMARYGAQPLFVTAALLLPALGFAFTRRLKRRRP